MADKQSKVLEVFSKNVRIYRKKACLTQEELAEKLNVSKNTVQNYERKEGFPTIENLDALVEVLKIEPYQLFISQNEKLQTARQFLEQVGQYMGLSFESLKDVKYDSTRSRSKR